MPRLFHLIMFGYKRPREHVKCEKNEKTNHLLYWRKKVGAFNFPEAPEVLLFMFDIHFLKI